ncbi:hypothetical protein [Streptomyces sp. NPDC094032]|uniref:hypothetical protein n=1 Tax=Streptomyces sp. NPDC094032 TaxID=3155308 RepID=UPI0033232388
MVLIGARGLRGARRAFGVLALLLAAFAVFVHHEAATAPAVAPVRAMTHGMAMAGHPQSVVVSDGYASQEAMAGMGACPAPGMGHCAAPVVDPPSVTARAVTAAGGTARHLAVPAGRPGPGPAPCRPPPDLSILSQLRI